MNQLALSLIRACKCCAELSRPELRNLRRNQQDPRAQRSTAEQREFFALGNEAPYVRLC
jgi:hypothetical protein